MNKFTDNNLLPINFYPKINLIFADVALCGNVFVLPSFDLRRASRISNEPKISMPRFL